MKYVKIFESFVDDVWNKLFKSKEEFDKSYLKFREEIISIKNEYHKAISDCMHDLTDEFESDSKVYFNKYWKTSSEPSKKDDLFCIFELEVPISKKDYFLESLFNVESTIKSYISPDKVIYIKYWIESEKGRNLFTKTIYSEDLKRFEKSLNDRIEWLKDDASRDQRVSDLGPIKLLHFTIQI